MYRITKLLCGFYWCECQLQDGNERFQERTLEDAIDAVKKFAKVMNGTKIKKKDIAFFKEEMVKPTTTVVKVNHSEI
jgi:hypothetical protein